MAQSADRRGGRPGGGSATRAGSSATRSLSGAELSALRERLRLVVDPVVNQVGLDLEHFEIVRAGHRFVVRVTVDGESGVGHNELSAVSREVSAALDQAEESSGEFPADSYTLEVSSPGIDRPLLLPRHWRRNVGRLVKVTAAGRSITARVTGVEESAVRFEGVVDPIGFADLGPGRVQVEFNRLTELTDEEIGEEFDPADDDDDLDDEVDGDDSDDGDGVGNDEGNQA